MYFGRVKKERWIRRLYPTQEKSLTWDKIDMERFLGALFGLMLTFT